MGLAVALLMAAATVATPGAEQAGAAYNLVVIEATPGGIAIAVRAACEGLRVLLVNRTQNLGGMLSNGLNVWDTCYEGHRGDSC